MPDRSGDANRELLASLKERAKELDCLYHVGELLENPERPLPHVFQSIANSLAPGMQYPNITRVLVRFGKEVYKTGDFEQSQWEMSAEIRVHGAAVGSIHVYYTQPRPSADQGPFLKEEFRLLRSVAERLSQFVALTQLKQRQRAAPNPEAREESEAWRSTIKLLRASDRPFYLKIARKMLNHLVGAGIGEASDLLRAADALGELEEVQGEINVPGRHRHIDSSLLLSDRPFEIAARHIGSEMILSLVQKWLQEDKSAFFIKVLANPRSSLPEIGQVVRRFRKISADEGLPAEVMGGLHLTLARRFLTDQLDFIKVAKDHLSIADYERLLDNLVMPAESHGKLGGKSAGLLLAAKVLEHQPDSERLVGRIKVPRTWYLSSDAILDFISQNDLEDIIEQKFKEIGQIRHEYPNIVQLFKDSAFPPDIVKGLSLALDSFGKVPLIIRSSSLLEDRLGTSFSGKYKSLFLANQGRKAERLEALLDAIAEIYASIFGPDPIEYRREKGLLEFSEEMGILIQEVVGRRVGRYFLPAFAGVAFSFNEFRWSPRIRREDGIIRLVPGLGTRAVDRLSDDYPALAVPGQPKLRANVALDEIVRYSPKMIDVIDLESNSLKTMQLNQLLREIEGDYPGLELVFSKLKGEMLQKPVRLLLDPEADELIATFNGLVDDSAFVVRMRHILTILETALGTPVDVEFAHDGKDFYLLQCRPQSFSEEDAPSPIPKDVPEEDVVFSANRFVSNGLLPDVTHIVYVDPEGYANLAEQKDLLGVARAVGEVNKLLPKRQFILMGPGRWGSRGDIKLGVRVTYADITNAAMIVEIARSKGGYVPDLSFGTHFFQDLVESRIRYLPLYPDDPKVHFDEKFFLKGENLLPHLLPEYAHLKDTLRVIDVPASSGGRVLRVLMNADLDEALGILASPGEPGQPGEGSGPAPRRSAKPRADDWRWRLRMAEHIADRLDGERFGVKALYVFGSTKNGTAGPNSDLDLLIHFRGSDRQREELTHWLEGWSLCLAEVNYLRTGYRTEGILDVHFVTDADIDAKDSFAIKIGAVTDPARELPLGGGLRGQGDTA